MSHRNPLVGVWFGIEFQGQIAGVFRECTGLGSENEVVEYKARGERGEFVIKKAPGRMKWTAICLLRGITETMDIWIWRKRVEDGKIEEARKCGSVVMFDRNGKEVARWNFINAWPSKLIGPLPSSRQDGAIEELEITHEGFERVK